MMDRGIRKTIPDYPKGSYICSIASFPESALQNPVKVYAIEVSSIELVD